MYSAHQPHPNQFIINHNNNIHFHQTSPQFRPQIRPRQRATRRDNGPYERHFTVLDSNPQNQNIPSYRLYNHPFIDQASSSPQNPNSLQNHAQIDLNIPPPEEKKPLLDLNKLPGPEHD